LILIDVEFLVRLMNLLVFHNVPSAATFSTTVLTLKKSSIRRVMADAVGAAAPNPVTRLWTACTQLKIRELQT
jgi:hypothetical protein